MMRFSLVVTLTAMGFFACGDGKAGLPDASRDRIDATQRDAAEGGADAAIDGMPSDGPRPDATPFDGAPGGVVTIRFVFPSPSLQILEYGINDNTHSTGFCHATCSISVPVGATFTHRLTLPTLREPAPTGLPASFVATTNLEVTLTQHPSLQQLVRVDVDTDHGCTYVDNAGDLYCIFTSVRKLPRAGSPGWTLSLPWLPDAAELFPDGSGVALKKSFATFTYDLVVWAADGTQRWTATGPGAVAGEMRPTLHPNGMIAVGRQLFTQAGASAGSIDRDVRALAGSHNSNDWLGLLLNHRVGRFSSEGAFLGFESPPVLRDLPDRWEVQKAVDTPGGFVTLDRMYDTNSETDGYSVHVFGADGVTEAAGATGFTQLMGGYDVAVSPGQWDFVGWLADFGGCTCGLQSRYFPRLLPLSQPNPGTQVSESRLSASGEYLAARGILSGRHSWMNFSAVFRNAP